MPLIDPRHPFASLYIWCAGLGMLVLYGLPLLLFPLRWARWLGWKLPLETELVVYLGRCVGALVLAIVFVCLRAAPAPASTPLLFELILAALGLIFTVHAWGAIRRTQPWLETAELALYGLLIALALYALYTLYTL
jgi:hypothetical protein